MPVVQKQSPPATGPISRGVSKVSVLVHPSSLDSNIFWTLKWTWHYDILDQLCGFFLGPNKMFDPGPPISSERLTFKVKLGEKLILQPTGCLKNNLLYLTCCWELTQLAGPIPWHTEKCDFGTSTSCFAGWQLLHIC